MKPDPCPPHLASDKFYEIALTIADHLDALVAYWDSNQVCLFANRAYRNWFGKTRKEMLGIRLEELLGPLYQKNLPHILGALAGQAQVFEREIPTPDGRIRYSLTTYTPHLVNGQVRGMIVHVADVTALKQLEQELKTAKTKAEELATHDFLTGLPNRVLLIDRIVLALAFAQRKHEMVAIISLDIDDFKTVNDTYGHGTGDRLLREIATRTKRSLRKSDTLTRLGGDEFLLLAPELESNAQAEILANRLLNAVRQPFHLGETTLSPTFSLGIALYPEHGTTPEALIANSDSALYIAKKLGKNRYAFANQGELRCNCQS